MNAREPFYRVVAGAGYRHSYYQTELEAWRDVYNALGPVELTTGYFDDCGRWIVARNILKTEAP